jgi:protein TonB
MRLPAASEFDLNVAGGSADWRKPSARRRAAAIGLTLVAELLFLIVLLGLSPRLPVKVLFQPQAVTIDLQPVSPATRKPQPKRTLQSSAKPQTQKPVIKPPPVTLPPPKLPVVPVTADELAAGDISKLGTKGAGPSQSATAAYGPGEGPSGAHLYNAEWYREPTNAELGYYLPKEVDRGSWAMIACRTIDHYHVDNCYLLGESPMGSGLARAMRLAAWQFLVRPPNIDGKPLIGSWVRIRIDFSDDGEKSGG